MHRKCYILFSNLYSIFGAFKVHIWIISTYIVCIPYEFCYVQILDIYLEQVKKYSIKCMPGSDFFFIANYKKMRPYKLYRKAWMLTSTDQTPPVIASRINLSTGSSTTRFNGNFKSYKIGLFLKITKKKMLDPHPLALTV